MAQLKKNQSDLKTTHMNRFGVSGLESGNKIRMIFHVKL